MYTVSALDKPALNTLKFHVFGCPGQLFFAFFCRPTDPTLVNHIDENHKNKWGWPSLIYILQVSYSICLQCRQLQVVAIAPLPCIYLLRRKTLPIGTGVYQSQYIIHLLSLLKLGFDD